MRQHENCKICEEHPQFDLDSKVYVHGEYVTKEQILKNQEDAKLCEQLVKLLMNHCGETGENEGAVDTLKRKLEDTEKLERVDSLFAELEIPLPYDLWLAESLQIRELLKKRKGFYVDDLHKCNEQGLHGKSLHYESIIEELNLLLGHKHNWKYFEHIKYCKPCGIYKTMSDKEQQKILEGEK